jgi:hypothetical protein
VRRLCSLRSGALNAGIDLRPICDPLSVPPTLDYCGNPLTDPANTFSVFIQQGAGASSIAFPDGLPAIPPPFSIWGDHPSSSIDIGHQKLASVSFVGRCHANP